MIEDRIFEDGVTIVKLAIMQHFRENIPRVYEQRHAHDLDIRPSHFFWKLVGPGDEAKHMGTQMYNKSLHLVLVNTV